jgi:hypothetical protein
MKRIWDTLYKPDESAPEPQLTNSGKKKEKPDDLFLTQMKKAKVDKRDELQIYLDEKTVASDSEPVRNGALHWWKAGNFYSFICLEQGHM